MSRNLMGGYHRFGEKSYLQLQSTKMEEEDSSETLVTNRQIMGCHDP
jgi:hypothetical protein